ncbi:MULTISPECIES: hypothetical protein [Lysinibacillus]|uniref:Uncharacterized protein n=1 Tax=Lysinibacillus tabacifolii TaxID=1173107 RepID=A0ABY2SW77_9BACI|nr:hypothetical protein [Lysinibacillus tabacifolii]TKI46646.1 hypothetical protein FC748_17300 [Lysinibacillus tabacifolii]
MKKVILTAFATTLIVTSGLSGAQANENAQNSGGWSESQGYFINDGFTTTYSANFEDLVSPPSDNPGFAAAASSTPDSHEGSVLRKTIASGNEDVHAVYGKTVWKNQPHYTTAQWEKTDGTVISTSGRKFWKSSTSTSEATSPYISLKTFRNEEARTYYSVD